MDVFVSPGVPVCVSPVSDVDRLPDAPVVVSPVFEVELELDVEPVSDVESVFALDRFDEVPMRFVSLTLASSSVGESGSVVLIRAPALVPVAARLLSVESIVALSVSLV